MPHHLYPQALDTFSLVRCPLNGRFILGRIWVFKKSQGFSLALEPVLEQLALNSQRYCLCLRAGIKGMCHHSPAFFCLFFVLQDSFSLCTLGSPEILFVDQAVFQLRQICPPLPPECWDCDMCHHYPVKKADCILRIIS